MMFAKQELAICDGFVSKQMIGAIKARAHNIAQKLTGIGLGLALGVIFISIGFNVFFNTNTTGWDSTTKLIWGYIPWVSAAVVIAILGVAAYASNHEM
jgi:uncharacterized membrane protein YphA (DoxX/SURF4 family)